MLFVRSPLMGADAVRDFNFTEPTLETAGKLLRHSYPRILAALGAMSADERELIASRPPAGREMGYATASLARR